MVALERGDIAWVDFPAAPIGSEPAGRRPALVVQANNYNSSGIATVIVAVITKNTRLANMPGNVLVTAGFGGLKMDSVVNVTQIYTINKKSVEYPIGELPSFLMDQVDAGLAAVLGLNRLK